MGETKKITKGSYEEALSLPTDKFIDFVYAYLPQVGLSMNDYHSMRVAGQTMMHMGNIMVFFSELEARAGLLKRELKWKVDEAENADAKKKAKQRYEEMVDKEKVISRAIHSLEIQYRAVNRALTICQDAQKDKYMPSGV